MKNNIFVLLLVCILAFSASSCEKDEIGGTASEKMAGEWYVTAVAIDEDGNVVYEDEDLFALGHFHLDTYNTSTNSKSEMWINDDGSLWDFKVKMNVDLKTKTFQVEEAENTVYEDCLVTITDGKILFGAATTPSGSVADSIVFTVSFSDDEYPAQYGYSAYRVAGFRYTGLSNDESH